MLVNVAVMNRHGAYSICNNVSYLWKSVLQMARAWMQSMLSLSLWLSLAEAHGRLRTLFSLLMIIGDKSYEYQWRRFSVICISIIVKWSRQRHPVLLTIKCHRHFEPLRLIISHIYIWIIMRLCVCLCMFLCVSSSGQKSFWSIIRTMTGVKLTHVFSHAEYIAYIQTVNGYCRS